MYFGAMLKAELRKVDLVDMVWDCGNRHILQNVPPYHPYCSECGNRAIETEYAWNDYPSIDDLLPYEMNEIDIGLESVFDMYLSAEANRSGDTVYFFSNHPAFEDTIPVPDDRGFAGIGRIDPAFYIENFKLNYRAFIEKISSHPGVVSSDVVFGFYKA